MERTTIVSRETLDDLEQFKTLLLKWNAKINLISKSSIPFIWDRHIWDSVQVSDLGENIQTWVDFGSGGGFPGLIVAILSKHRGLSRHVSLVESDQRKCAFLRTAIRELTLNATVISKRIEELDPLEVQVVSARALADLDDLLGYADQHLSKHGKALFLKGATWENEVEIARKKWSFDLRVHKSKTSPESAILEIKEIKRV